MCNGMFSSFRYWSNGIKRGDVASLVLFCLYIDSTLFKLLQFGVECYIGSMFTAALEYADIMLLALRNTLSICESCANTFDLKLNVDKSECMIVSCHCRQSSCNCMHDMCSLYLDALCIENVKHYSSRLYYC